MEESIDIEELADMLHTMCIDVGTKVIKEGKKILPVFLIPKVDEDGERCLNAMFLDFKDDKEKVQELLKIKIMLDMMNVNFYIFTCEGWMANANTEDEIRERMRKGKLSEQPDSMEVIQILFVHRNGFKKSWTYRIFREGDNVVFNCDSVTNEVLSSLFVLF